MGSSPTSSSDRQWPPSVVVEDSDGGEQQQQQQQQQRQQALSDSKMLWSSDDQDDGGILDRFLKVQQFKELRVASTESDGMPSVAPIHEDVQERDRALEDSYEEEEDPPGRTVEDFFQVGLTSEEEEDNSNLGFSHEEEEEEEEDAATASINVVVSSIESVNSSSPVAALTMEEAVDSEEDLEKRGAMDRFEETLKNMIREARDLPQSVEDEQQQQEDDEEVAAIERQKFNQMQDGGRAKKSPSAQSTSESVISVIELPRIPTEQAAPIISVTHEDNDEQGLNSKMSLGNNDSLNSDAIADEETLEFQRKMREVAQLKANQKQQKWRQQRPHSFPDRYRGGEEEEEEAVTTSRPQLMQPLASPRLSAEREAGMAVRHGRESPLMVGFGSGGGGRTVVASNNNNNNHHTPDRLNTTEAQNSNVDAPPISNSSSSFKPRPIEVTADPTLPPTPLPDPMSNDANPTASSSLFQLRMPRNLPYWFLITYTYSLVLVFILLVANLIPDGKLYIHLTAFWTVLIYALLDEEEAAGQDIIENVVERFIR